MENIIKDDKDTTTIDATAGPEIAKDEPTEMLNIESSVDENPISLPKDNDSKEEYEEEEEEEDENEEEEGDEDDIQEGENPTDYFLRMQKKRNTERRDSFYSEAKPESTFSFKNTQEEEPAQQERVEEKETTDKKKRYEGADSWKNLDDKDYYEENAIKLTQLIDTATTEGLRKIAQFYLVEGKMIREIKTVIDTFRKRSAESKFVYLEQEEYIKCLESYVKLYEEDIPMPNNLKRALAVFLRVELKKWLDKNADSPLIGLGVAMSGWIGNLGIKAASIKSGLVEPEIVDDGKSDNDDDDDGGRVINIDHVQ